MEGTFESRIIRVDQVSNDRSPGLIFLYEGDAFALQQKEINYHDWSHPLNRQ